ncbi:MAG: hypothetical protein GY719_36375 [bacterium]|nr:hypothetical protein [bacterium]
MNASHSRVGWKMASKMASSKGLSVTEYQPRSPAAAKLRAVWVELDLVRRRSLFRDRRLRSRRVRR